MTTFTEPQKRCNNKLSSFTKKNEIIFHNICKKPKNSRTHKDNIYLYQNCKNLQCFKKIININYNGDLMYKSIIKNLDFAFYEPGKIIYSPKELITNIFYIFQGSVAVYKEQQPKIIISSNKNNNQYFNQEGNITLNFTKQMDSARLSNRKNSLRRSKTKSVDKTYNVMRFYSSIDNNKDNNILKFKKKSVYNDSEVDEINYILTAGEDYGINDLKSVRRVELVKSKSKCIIGFLSKQDYKYIFEKTDILEKLDAVNFLKNVKIFKSIKCDIIIENILNATKKKYYQKGDYLAKVGDEFNSFYIIKKGGFEVYLTSKKKFRNIFNDINDFGHFTLREKSENIKYQIKNYYIDNIEYKIIKHGQGEIIGDIEYYLDSKKFLTNIVCSTENSVVYEINCKDFFIFTPKYIKKLLINGGEMKRDYYRQRVKDINEINSKMMCKKKNQFREIINKKLEDEKGEIFKKMETKDNIKKLKVKFKEINKLNLCNNNKNITTSISADKQQVKFQKNCIYFKSNFKNYFNDRPISKQIINTKENSVKIKCNLKDYSNNDDFISRNCNTCFNKTEKFFRKTDDYNYKTLNNKNTDNNGRNDNNNDTKVNLYQKNSFRLSGKIPKNQYKSKSTNTYKKLCKLNMEFQQILTNLYINQDKEFPQKKKSDKVYCNNKLIKKNNRISTSSKNKNQKIFISCIDDSIRKNFYKKGISSFDEMKDDEKSSIENKLSFVIIKELKKKNLK